MKKTTTSLRTSTSSPGPGSGEITGEDDSRIECDERQTVARYRHAQAQCKREYSERDQKPKQAVVAKSAKARHYIHWWLELEELWPILVSWFRNSLHPRRESVERISEP